MYSPEYMLLLYSTEITLPSTLKPVSTSDHLQTYTTSEVNKKSHVYIRFCNAHKFLNNYFPSIALREHFGELILDQLKFLILCRVNNRLYRTRSIFERGQQLKAL